MSHTMELLVAQTELDFPQLLRKSFRNRRTGKTCHTVTLACCTNRVRFIGVGRFGIRGGGQCLEYWGGRQGGEQIPSRHMT